MTSLPLSVLTSSIHFDVCWNELTSVERGEKQSRGKLKMPFVEFAVTFNTLTTLLLVTAPNKTINISAEFCFFKTAGWRKSEI